MSQLACTHLVQFYETDQMTIVHHSNYLRFMEEARVAWAKEKGLIDYQKIESASHFAVLESRVKHVKPAFFGDHLRIFVQVQRKTNRVFFQYRIQNQKDEVVALGETIHVSLGLDLKVKRLPANFIELIGRHPWTETWL
ncbi:MAG: acyl-CoA thioesterase [Pseudobdellovibrionaceae bacterium]|jgi:acyl-CoA thioester hydrolase